MLIRPALLSERADLIELQRRASLANPGDRDALLAHPEAVDTPMEQFADGNVLVASDGDTLLGFSAIYIRDDGNAELDGLFVEPAGWKRGIGRRLVEAAAARAASHGAERLHVVGNPHAEGFYKRVGFVVVGTFATQFGPGLLMTLSLNRACSGKVDTTFPPRT